ncbi:MAG: hypothetical protein QW087_08130, partial [Methanomassiliicoccales archaeon]
MAHEWLDALRTYGIFVSKVVLKDKFPGGVKIVDRDKIEKLRTTYREFEAGVLSIEEWLWTIANVLMEIENRPLMAFRNDVLKHLKSHESLKGLTIPDGVVLSFSDLSGIPRLYIWFSREHSAAGLSWSRACAEAHRFLRSYQGEKVHLGMVTNGIRFRVYYIDIESETWIEWDASRWFEETSHQDEMYGFGLLLNKDMLGVDAAGVPPLENLVRESRKRQGDISAQLGERLRCAVEMMINRVVNPATERSSVHGAAENPLDIISKAPNGQRLPEEAALKAIYQAAIRTVMRIVFISYAESRSLLPMDAQAYVTGYSIQHLYETLEKNRIIYGEDYLRHEVWAWPRIVALFRLIFNGCSHPEL